MTPSVASLSMFGVFIEGLWKPTSFQPGDDTDSLIPNISITADSVQTGSVSPMLFYTNWSLCEWEGFQGR